MATEPSMSISSPYSGGNPSQEDRPQADSSENHLPGNSLLDIVAPEDALSKAHLEDAKDESVVESGPVRVPLTFSSRGL